METGLSQDQRLIERLNEILRDQGYVKLADGVRLTISEALNLPEMTSNAVKQHHEFKESIRSAILSAAKIPTDEVIMLNHGRGGQMGFYPNFFAGPLAKKLTESGSATAALQWLDKILSTKEAGGHHITALWGVPLSQKIEISETISLVPFAELPDSSGKQQIAPDKSPASSLPLGIGLSQVFSDGPSSAILVKHNVKPFVIRLRQNTGPTSPQRPETLGESDDIITVLHSFGPRTVIPLGTWFSFEDPDYNDLIYAGMSCRLWEFHPHFPQCGPEIEAEALKRRLRAFQALAKADKKKVETAINRLGYSILRLGDSNKALELAIALETLLGDNELTGMAHKSRTRAGRFLGGTGQQRKRSADIVRKVYDIRSALVHAGTNTTKDQNIGGSKISVHDLIIEATTLVCKIIEKVLEQGNIPSWETFDLEIGPVG